MSIDSSEIERMIRTGLPDCTVRIDDLRGDGQHYAAVVISPSFTGKTRVQQHQMVYQTLQGKMGNEIHALAIQTKEPD